MATLRIDLNAKQRVHTPMPGKLLPLQHRGTAYSKLLMPEPDALARPDLWTNNIYQPLIQALSPAGSLRQAEPH